MQIIGLTLVIQLTAAIVRRLAALVTLCSAYLCVGVVVVVGGFTLGAAKCCLSISLMFFSNSPFAHYVWLTSKFW